MQSEWKWTRRGTQVLNRKRVIRCYQLCRDRLGFTDEQARRMLKGTTQPSDVDAAAKRYLERRS